MFILLDTMNLPAGVRTAERMQYFYLINTATTPVSIHIEKDRDEIFVVFKNTNTEKLLFSLIIGSNKVHAYQYIEKFANLFMLNYAKAVKAKVPIFNVVVEAANVLKDAMDGKEGE